MYAMADPDLQFSGGGRFGAVIQNLRWGDGLKNNFFRPFADLPTPDKGKSGDP